jgi:hypothetical protein
MLFGEKVPVYCENREEHTNTLRGQNEPYNVKPGGTYSQLLLWFKALSLACGEPNLCFLPIRLPLPS